MRHSVSAGQGMGLHWKWFALRVPQLRRWESLTRAAVVLQWGGRVGNRYMSGLGTARVPGGPPGVRGPAARWSWDRVEQCPLSQLADRAWGRPAEEALRAAGRPGLAEAAVLWDVPLLPLTARPLRRDMVHVGGRGG